MTVTVEQPAPRTEDDGEAVALALVPSGLHIAGEWIPSGSGTFPVLNPATGEVLTEVARASTADVEAALGAADSAQEFFAHSSPRFRADLLLAVHREVLAHEDALARLITLEMGKPLEESLGEVRYAADFLRWFAEEAPRVQGSHRVLPDGRSRMVVTPRPVGVCILITPWNFPLAMATRKIAPAIAAGCCSILKPAEDTPLTSLAFVEILRRCGVPAGVVNVLTTDAPAELVHQLLTDSRTRKVSFTGSTEVGRHLLATAAQQVLRTSMELGGNAPFIVFHDADLDAAADGLMQAKFRNGGQACTAANRVFVHQAVEDEFLRRLTDRVARLQIGPGTDPSTTLGPLIHADAARATHEVVTDAVSRGATLRLGGTRPAEGSAFYPATVLVDVPDDSRAFRCETFAPVVAVSTFADEDDVVARANATEFGLVAYVYTRDAARHFRLPERLHFGMVAMNRGLVSNAAAPFGGVKHSGMGREGSTEGINEYLEFVYTAIDA